MSELEQAFGNIYIKALSAQMRELGVQKWLAWGQVMQLTAD